MCNCRMHNRDEVFLDYKLQHELQYRLQRQALDVRVMLKSMLNCKRSVIPSGYGAVDVVQVRQRSGNVLKAHFANLYNCKSLWACPTCAAFGLNRHREKISACIEHWERKGYWAAMITFSVPHNFHEPLSVVFDRLVKVRNTVRPSQYLPGCHCSIKSTEVTYNDAHGWHPHYHILYFIPKADWHMLAERFDTIRRRWASTVAKLYGAEGYGDDDAFYHRCTYLSLDRKGAPRKITNGDYIAKELAKTMRGHHKLKSRSPFELLETNDPRDFDLWLEYAMFTKGKTRVHYSTGTQKGVDFTEARKKKAQRLGIEAYEEVVLCSFTRSDWYEIVDRELIEHVRHRRRILICAIIGFDRVRDYCLAQGLPLPQEPMRQYSTSGRAILEAMAS